MIRIFNTKPMDSILDFFERCYYIFLAIILMFAAFNLFYNLGNTPISSWDEARHGVSAFEMIKNNNYIVNTYAYSNDYWNLKPPLSYWAIIAGYKLFGYNALGLRFFSAVAALLTILVVAIFTLIKHGRLASIISTAVLTATMPYIIEHCARTGDADSIFILFFTLSIISMLMIEKSIGFLYCTGVFFAFAFLAKSWHTISIIAIVGSYLILSGILFKLKAREFILFLLSSILPIFIWGIFRFTQDGLIFFKTMIDFDLLKRTSTTLEGHIGSTSFYIERLQFGYFYWLLVLVSSVVSLTLLLEPDIVNKKLFNYILAIFLWIAVPFLLYTKAKTKISWYILPIYPALAMSLGGAVSGLLKSKKRNLVLQILLSLMLLFSFYKNEISIINMVSHNSVDNVQELIKELGSMLEYRGKNIYSLYKSESADNPDRWDQSYLLCSELYGDMVPKEGEIEDFLEDTTDKPLFLVPKNSKQTQKLDRYNLKVVLENKSAYIFSK
ncbi:undecaprenyl phosphate-alpha-4-amino-4-deoxy-L-arabinose arabinosyl transferase [Clostridium homopropionicum DSM 5847]|uniref:Undecaprenyl phosphate-alpha-4-amino-4-deoxy-L-arabinose arabinosyl transferase n=1 Tax=Clostridium homopropionicum DSM 5847 TaxID=1121318 RepID=A0A0L6ZD36_9CLOT|nr:glycosyltransferase family 39 protein [Clostridium homopropionicum]KOA20688.1 undecaprenyl phosphate-alpha-4-amino-4-deoxy-L-arabinose arabinosyl transferase [Clostridium homopropionicum DSM 5847]SFF91439.1 Dolichyl-phosphate-mannose-protein mannosyltransferase [Clostridium homopropionicum]